MLDKFLFVLFLGLLLAPLAADSKDTIRTSPDDYVFVYDVAYENCRKYHEAAKAQVTKHPSYVRFIINSNGGSFDHTSSPLFDYMDSLVKQGTRVECVINTKAYSMGAIIFSHCSHRYATKGSSIMWHGVRHRSMNGMNQFELQESLDQARKEDDLLWGPLRNIIRDDAYFFDNFKKERLIPIEEIALLYPDVVQLVELEIEK